MGRPKKSVTIITRETGSEVQNEQYELARAYTEIPKSVLKDLKRKYFYQPSYVPGDPYGMAYREGQRSVVLDIFSQLKASQHPEMFETPEEEGEIQF